MGLCADQPDLLLIFAIIRGERGRRASINALESLAGAEDTWERGDNSLIFHVHFHNVSGTMYTTEWVRTEL